MSGRSPSAGARSGWTVRFRAYCTKRTASPIPVGKRAGVLPGQVHGAMTCGQAAATGHPADEMHYVRAAELAHALASTSVPGISPHIKLADPDNFADELNGRTGIIFFDGNTRLARSLVKFPPNVGPKFL